MSKNHITALRQERDELSKKRIKAQNKYMDRKPSDSNFDYGKLVLPVKVVPRPDF